MSPCTSFPRKRPPASSRGASRLWFARARIRLTPTPAILAPRGRYVQFTYGPRPPLPPNTIAALGLTVNKGNKVWANLPPATVYRFRRA